MLDALIVPLAALGQNEGLIFNGPVGNGISLLGDLGNSLSQFALGVAAMANLQVPTYEVKDGKLVLVSTKPLDPNFAESVAKNIDMLVSALIDPISKLGEEGVMNSFAPATLNIVGNLSLDLPNGNHTIQVRNFLTGNVQTKEVSIGQSTASK